MVQATIVRGLGVSSVAKSYNGTRVLQPLDLDIEPGEIHALLGENGSGKSTFIKVLAGVLSPDSDSPARVTVDGEEVELGHPTASYRAGFRFVHQDLGLVEDLSVADNILLNSGYPTRFGTIRNRETSLTAAETLASVGLDVNPSALVRTLSPATRTLVAVARALRPDGHSRAKVLVFDEPTASLPDHEVNKLLDAIRAVAAKGIAVIYVTHRLDEVFSLTRRLTVLRDGHRIATRETDGLTRPELVHLLVGDAFEQMESDKPDLPSIDSPIVLSVQGLRAGRIKEASFSVRAGEVVGIAGLTGSGSETVLQAIFGRVARDSGEITIGGKAVPGKRPDLAMASGAAYLPAERKISGGFMMLTARENLTIGDLKSVTRGTFVRRKSEIRDARDWFTRLSVRPAKGYESLLSTFSGGNQQKVLFAKWLRRRPAVFLLDEPTQGVDVNAKALLHRELHLSAATGMGVLVNSTDVEELAALCHRVLIFRDGKIAQELMGSAIQPRTITRSCVQDD